jgi:lincosamide nucleotidyltransferase
VARLPTGGSTAISTEIFARVTELIEADDEIYAALTYGSVPQGVADQYSDIEFWLFGTVPDGAAWCRRVGPVNAMVHNEFGAYVVFFPGLIRGEFHFAADIEAVATWPSRGAPVDRMVLKDSGGRLADALSRLPADAPVPSTADEVATVCGRFANWVVLARNVEARGEAQRTHDALSHVRRHLLWMARLAYGATGTWLTPSRRAESELPADVVAAVTDDLVDCWRLGRALWLKLAMRYDFEPPAALFAELDARIS